MSSLFFYFGVHSTPIKFFFTLTHMLVQIHNGPRIPPSSCSQLIRRHLYMIIGFTLLTSFRRRATFLRASFSVSLLKGTVSRDFLLLVFSWSSFPQAPEYTIRAVSNFFENSRRYSQLKVDHRCQQYQQQICRRVNYTGGKLPPVSATTAANLPPVSTTPVAINGINIRLQIP
jgi:hypothetical protein